MIVKQCIMTLSRCYRETTEDFKHGIIVHSTGCNNTSLKRYIQPSADDPFYDDIIADIGKNVNKNSWNQTNVAKGVHAFIGKNKAGVVECYQVLPYEKNAWGVAAGKNGSVNYGDNSRIQFEICEDSLANRNYFVSAMDVATDYCALLCHEYGWDVFHIWSHKEAIQAGYGSGTRVDIDYWLGKFGKDMTWFRAEVARKLKELNNPTELKIGDVVKLDPSATVWGKTKKFSSWVYKSKLYVRAIKGDKVTISIFKKGAITGSTDRKFLTKIE